MSKNHSLLKKITKIIFGNTVSKIPKQRTCRKRMFGFESLENRELLSVSPLLPGLFSSYQSSFEQNTFAYVDDNSAVKTNHTDYTVESAERSETVTAMSFQTEEGEMMDCCTNNMGTITATVEITNLGETTATGLGTQGIVHIERSNDDDCGIYSNVTVTYRLSGTATPGSDYSAASSLSYYEDEDGNYYYEGTFGISANTATYDFPIYVLNDGIVESSETIIFTLVSAEVEYCAEYTVTGSASFTIKDDDKWKVSVVTTDGTATERLSDVAQDYGEFKFVRTFSGEDEDDEGTGDQSYGITAVFDMIYDSGNTMSAKYGNDYSLQYQNTSGQWVSLTSSNSFATGDPPVSHYRFSVTIPAGQTEVKVRLVPTFDWSDEAELFDPSGDGTPKDDDGELADVELVSASWSGMGSNWNPLGDNTEGQIEIKDGAVCLITTDSNNDGTIDMNDRDPNVKNNSNAPGKVIRVNTDDDDQNGELDKWQRPDQFDTAMNPAALAGTAPSVTVQDEDDLAETVLYVWVDNLTKTTGSSLYFDVYSVFPTDLVMWTASTKGSRLHRGVVDNNCITEQTRLTTLSNASGQNVFTRTVYMEAVNVITGTVTLQAMPVLNTNALSGSDSVKMTGYIFDVDMNTDNFDGTMITSLPTMPARIEREEIYEDHEYGLGIVMLADEPLTPEVEQYYYPMVIEVTSSMAILSPKITFDHVESTKSGGIQIYQLVNGNYQLLQSETEYTLEQLGFTNTLNIATIYVLPTRKHQVVSEWFNPFLNNTKPDSEITVTFSFNNITLEENIHYIISSQASFWNNYLHNPSIRSAFAATGVYGSDADTPTAHATPTSLDLPQFSLQLINNSSNLMEMGFDEETAELFGANNQNGLNVCVYYDHITGNAILAFQGSDPLALAKPIFASSGLFTQDQMNTWSSSKILRKLSGSSKINEALQKLNDGLIYGSSTPDWVCNVAQSKGYATPQYDTAMYIGQRLPKNFVNVNSAISINKITGWTITGHSLGGGLASAAASVCGNLEGPQSIGNRAETFNAAGLHSNTVSVFLNNTSYRASGTSPSIIAYRTESDELTELQEYAPVSACNALGTPYCLEDFVDDGNTNAISEVWPGHEMKSVIQGLLVDIMVHPSGNLIIDSNDGVCVNGTWQWTVSGTILVGTTPYAY